MRVIELIYVFYANKSMSNSKKKVTNYREVAIPFAFRARARELSHDHTRQEREGSQVVEGRTYHIGREGEEKK